MTEEIEPEIINEEEDPEAEEERVRLTAEAVERENELARKKEAEEEE